MAVEYFLNIKNKPSKINTVIEFFLNFENIPNKSTLPKIKENYECSVAKYYKKLAGRHYKTFRANRIM